MKRFETRPGVPGKTRLYFEQEEDIMYPLRVVSEKSPVFAELWETYETSFPASERRTLEEQIRIFTHPRYRLDAWLSGSAPDGGNTRMTEDVLPGMKDGAFLGLMGWWEYTDFRYVEHLAIAPEARSGGIGGKILRNWMDMSAKPVYLEIDEITDEISRRRLGFYQRLGFVENDIEHAQPDFQGGDGTVPLRVLSYPGFISREQYSHLDSALHADVWPQGLCQNKSFVQLV